MGESKIIGRAQLAVFAAIVALVMGFTLSLGVQSAYAADNLRAAGGITTQSQPPSLSGKAATIAYVGATAKVTVTDSTVGQTGTWTVSGFSSAIAEATTATTKKVTTALNKAQSFAVTFRGVKPGKTTATFKFTTDSNVSKTYPVTITVNAGLPKNKTATVGNFKYKVTANSTKAASCAVMVTGPKSKTLRTIAIPATVKINTRTYKVTAIADNAFKSMTKMTKVTVGNNVATIGKNAFTSCAKLSSVTLGTGVKKIGATAFAKDTKLKTITIKSTKLTKAGVKNCLKSSSVKTVKVPASKLKAYKTYFTKANCGAKVTVKK